MKQQKFINFLVKFMPFKTRIKKIVRPFHIKYKIKKNIRQHKEVASYLSNYIREYIDGQILKIEAKPKKDLGTDKIIWQFWAQGVDENIPIIVKSCFESVKKYSSDYKVIILTIDTIKDYIDLPNVFYDKLENNKEFTITFFSDILRLYLLSAYGGVWIDATILLTGPIDKKLLNKNFFMYQRTQKPKDYKDWQNVNIDYFGWEEDWKVNLLNSFIIAKKDNTIINALKDILTTYWEKEDKFIHYFLFQILFNELVQIEPYKSLNCEKISDLYPHLMHKTINETYSKESWDNITSKSNIHKLRYYSYIPHLSILEKIISTQKPTLRKPLSDCSNITFCTMCFNLKSKNLDKIKNTERNFEDFYLKSLKTLCTNFKNIVLWCDKETSDFLDKNNIKNIKKRVVELDELPLFDKKEEHLKILSDMKKSSFNEGYLLKNLEPQDIIDYVTLVHSKIEVIKWAKDNNFYNTDYFYWIDAGISNNPIYYRCWIKWNGIIDSQTKKFKCAFMTHYEKIYRSIIELSDIEDIALIKAPFEIAAGIFLVNKDIVDEFYSAYKKTFNFLISKNLFSTEQSIFSTMLKMDFENLFEFSKTVNYCDVMGLVASKDTVEKIKNDKPRIFYKKALLSLVKFLPKKMVNTFKQRFLYRK